MTKAGNLARSLIGSQVSVLVLCYMEIRHISSQLYFSILYGGVACHGDSLLSSGRIPYSISTGTSDPLGKRLNNSKTRQELEWEPKYPSFAEFLGVSE